MSSLIEFVRGMDSAEFVDPYLIPGTKVLRNLVGADTNANLAAAEADLSFARATQLLENPFPRQMTSLSSKQSIFDSFKMFTNGPAISAL
jgi:fido (protein-threonine AMPylation protein)